MHSAARYPLKKSALLDSGATIHIFNDIDRFEDYRPAEPGDFIYAGQQQVPIQGYGHVNIHTQGRRGVVVIRLRDVAHCENFPCNLVSLRQLHKRGYWWDNRLQFNCLRTSSNEAICKLVDRYGQFIIEDVPEEMPESVFAAQRHRFNSWTERRPAYK